MQSAQLPDEAIDLNDWISSLQRDMFDINEIFRAETERPEKRQLAVLSALTVVLGHLHQIRGFGEVIGPMDALWYAYQGLCEGSSHPLFDIHEGKPGGRKLTLAQQLLQARSVGMLEILIDAGWSEDDAVKKITEVLVACGVKGFRKKATVTVKVLQGWRTKANSGDAPGIRDLADRYRATQEASFELATGRLWPPSKREAERLIETYLQNQPFRDLAKFSL